MDGSLSPLSSRESTPRPRSPTPSADPGPSTAASGSSQPGSAREVKTSPAQSHSSTLDLQDLELSDSDDSDDEIVVTGEVRPPRPALPAVSWLTVHSPSEQRIVTPRSPIKPLPQANRTPHRPPPPFPLTFTQFPASQRRQQS
jgi:hypothetical protein